MSASRRTADWLVFALDLLGSNANQPLNKIVGITPNALYHDLRGLNRPVFLRPLRRNRRKIRMAIGAPRAGIVRMVIFDIFLMVTVGGCAGLLLGLGTARYVESPF